MALMVTVDFLMVAALASSVFGYLMKLCRTLNTPGLGKGAGGKRPGGADARRGLKGRHIMLG